jgi:hypothetical protein
MLPDTAGKHQAVETAGGGGKCSHCL